MNFSPGSPSRPEWHHSLARRLRTAWPIKLVGLTLGLTLFFAGYGWLLRHPIFPVTTMPLLAVDYWIAFWPPALPVYLSLWFYLSLAPGLLIERRELTAYAVAAIGLSVVGLGIFLVWPTTVPVRAVEGPTLGAFAWLQTIDAAGNACPSLHVAFAVLTASWLHHVLRAMGAGFGWQALNWAWCVGIAYSTIAVRQHVAVDVGAGAALGALVAFGSLRGAGRRLA